MKSELTCSLVVPCYNEEDAIEETVRDLTAAFANGGGFEIIVVNDGSTDGSRRILERLGEKYPDVRVLAHERNRGYGAALKTGIRQARAELIAITDADGTYPSDRIPELVATCENYDMVVGARVADDVQYSRVRALPKFFLKKWMSWVAGQNIPDINSGMRVFRKSVVESFIGILPDSFSFTVTITLAMLTNYRPTLFVPISYSERVGNSKIKPVSDTLRFIMLILRTGVYFAPLRAFFPFVCVLGTLALGSFLYDIFALSNLTDKTVLLFLFSMNAGMFALLADMIDKRSR
ncbi:MAG: glycosyltransferase family 2 protein [Acidiferrobacterales bacterium]